MEKEHVLTGGIETLNTIKEHILELDGCKEKKMEFEARETQLENILDEKERIISTEISETLKNRRVEVVITINQQIEETKLRYKKVKIKKDKLKGTKISERIKIETTDLHEENKNLRHKSKKLFKEDKVLQICNTKLYYALFSPKYLIEFLTVAIAMLLAFGVIPCGIYYFVLPEEKMIYLALIYFITIVLIGGSYILLYKITKSQHRDTISQGRVWRNEMHVNQKKIRSISKSIIKDKDESAYGLDKLNKELNALTKNIDELEDQKKEALSNFDNTTKLVISSEIRVKYEEEIQRLNTEYDDVNKEIQNYADKIRQMTLTMANNYEAYIGKEFLTIDKLEELYNIMTENKISTISGALAFLNNKI